MREHLTAMLLVAALGGCGGGDTTMTVPTGDGGSAQVTADADGQNMTFSGTDADGNAVSGTIASGEGTPWPKEAPDYAPPYPGGQVTMTMGGNTDEGSSMSLGFTTKDAPDKVIAFYVAKAKAAGLGNPSTMSAGGQRMVTFSDKATGRSLLVSTNVEGGETTASLIYGTSRG
jgi:hypothetical protein